MFGSLIPNNFITVDKLPVSQWVMGLSGSCSIQQRCMLVLEVISWRYRVGAVCDRSGGSAGPNAALLAGAALATAVAALMFRFNNPDAVMVLLMHGRRVLHRAGTPDWAGARRICAGRCRAGLAFLAKMLEGLMVMPAIGSRTSAMPVPARRWCRIMLGSPARFVVSAGWSERLTLVWPVFLSRPYLAGLTDNNFMNSRARLQRIRPVLGHNIYGFDRGGLHSGAAAAFHGRVRLEIGWLLPAALLAVVLVLIRKPGSAHRHRAGRRHLLRHLDGDRRFAPSFMKSMVTGITACRYAGRGGDVRALGVTEMWRIRDGRLGQFGFLGGTLPVTGAWSWWILAATRRGCRRWVVDGARGRRPGHRATVVGTAAGRRGSRCWHTSHWPCGGLRAARPRTRSPRSDSHTPGAVFSAGPRAPDGGTATANATQPGSRTSTASLDLT